MKRDHARFETLAGAVMLGEATAAERAAFDEHAATCDACRADVAYAPATRRAIVDAASAETWRPELRTIVLGRIRDTRRSRFRATVRALGWGVAISIVFNVAIASGLASRMAPFSSSADPASPGVTALRIRLESPAPRRARIVPPRAIVVARAPAERAPLRAAIQKPRRVPVLPPAPADVPDVLAGLDLGGGDSRRVAVEPRVRCTDGDAGVERVDAPSPCPERP